MGQDTEKTGRLSTVTLSVCSEVDPNWNQLASVPVTMDSEGTIHAPIAQAIRGNNREEDLKRLRESESLFSVRREFEGFVTETTYLPLKDVHFKNGRAVPLNPEELKQNIKAVADKLRAVINGTYRCIDWQETRPVIYVVGRTDTVGSERSNLALSRRRARTIAEAVRSELGGAEIEVCYTGVGEAETATGDGVPFPEARRADVMIASEGRPFDSRWRCLKKEKKGRE